jgi:hypothetical protein
VSPGEQYGVRTDLLYRRALSLEYFTVACAVEVIAALATAVLTVREGFETISGGE